MAGVGLAALIPVCALIYRIAGWRPVRFGDHALKKDLATASGCSCIKNLFFFTSSRKDASEPAQFCIINPVVVRILHRIPFYPQIVPARLAGANPRRCADRALLARLRYATARLPEPPVFDCRKAASGVSAHAGDDPFRGRLRRPRLWKTGAGWRCAAGLRSRKSRPCLRAKRALLCPI